MQSETFDSNEYTLSCSNCGEENRFRKDRELSETHYLSLIEDGVIYTDDEDIHVRGEWIYSCDHCGADSYDLENLLELRPDEAA